METIDSICDTLKLNELGKISFVKDISTKLGIKPAHLGLGLILFVLLFVLFGFGDSLISLAVGTLYPAYMSFKTIESSESIQDLKQWLTYWVVFTFIYASDEILGFIFSIIPFYEVIKIGFYIWLFHPKTKGATKIYEALVKPILKKHEAAIDKHLGKIAKTVEDAKPLLSEASHNLKTQIVEKAIN